MGLLDGKVALITGAGGGLGEAYAKLFAREGAAVVVNDLGGPRDGSGADVSMAQKVVNAIKEEGGRAVANGSDISTMAGGQSVFEDAIKNFGRADILVNNAGILLDQTFAKATEAAWDKVLKVHLKGTFCVTQPVFPGETVTMEMWKDGNVVSFEAKVKSRGVTVIKSGKTVLG